MELITGVDCDVLIIGAGPTGLVCAAELIHQGITNIRIIDKLEQPAKIAKATVISLRTLELLSSYEGVLDMIQTRASKIRKFQFFSSGVKIAEFDASMLRRSKHADFITCEQWWTELCLTKFVNKHGIFVERGEHVVEVQDKGDFVTVQVKNVVTESVRNIVSKFVIASDGIRSAVRKLLNMDFAGITLNVGFHVAHLRFKDDSVFPYQRDTFTITYTPQGMGFISPMTEKSWFIAIDMVGSQEDPFLEEKTDSHGMKIQKEITVPQLEQLFKERGYGNVEIAEVMWKSHYRVHGRVSSKFSNGNRVFLAGDACHVQTPLGAQGMNSGIQDGVNLCWKLAYVLRGTLGAKILDSYEIERREVVQRSVSSTTKAQTIASSRSPLIQFMRNMRFRVVGSFTTTSLSFLTNNAQSRYSYSSSPLSEEHWEKPSINRYFTKRREQNVLRLQTSNRLNAGDQIPLVDSVISDRTTGFRLIVFIGRTRFDTDKTLSLAQCRDVSEKLVRSTGGIICGYTLVGEEQTSIYDAFGINGQCVFLVRPDNHVALRCEPFDENFIREFLVSRLFGTRLRSPGGPRNGVKGDWILNLLVLIVSIVLCYLVYSQYRRH